MSLVTNRSGALVLGFAALIVGCGTPDSDDSDEWSEAARANSAHIWNAVRAAQQALGTEQELSSGPTGTWTETEVEKIKQPYREALHQARLVHDSVLRKISPEFRRRFREEFQRGLQLQLNALDETEQKTAIRMSMEGVRLLNSWGRWYEENRREWQIPAPE